MEYDDGLIQTTADALVIRRYNLALQTKRIPYAEIRGVTEMRNGWINGRARLWGTTVPGTWLNLDFKRAGKTVAFKVSTEAKIAPILTPDEPQRFSEALRAHGVSLS